MKEINLTKVLFFILTCIYSCFVIKTLWGWFIVPFGIIPINMPWALGLSCLFSTLSPRESDFNDEKHGGNSNPFESIFTLTCILAIGFIAHKFM